MNDFDSLSQSIHTAASLTRQEATGFYAVHCPVCRSNEKKGGFKFEHDQIIYNCFRGKCDATCVHTKGEPVSKKFKELMRILGVKIPPSILMVRSSLHKKMKEELDEELYKKHTHSSIDFKDGELTDDIPSSWISFLNTREIPHKFVSFIETGKYRGNLFLPFYWNKKLIGGQILTRSKYVFYTGGNKHLLYQPEQYTSDKITLIVEGGIDAACFPNTVAVLGDSMTPEQAYQLRHRKNVVMLPDRSGGNKFINQFYGYGWGICIPSWTEKDLNDAVCKRGHLLVANNIKNHIYYDKFKAEVAFRMWRQKDGQ